MHRILEVQFPPSFPCTVNGRTRTLLYYLADGIYPSWALFVKKSEYRAMEKDKAYENCQEAVRKDVKRAFGVLLARFNILQNPCLLWRRSDMAKVMTACIILHNLIVESRRDHYESGMASLQHYDESRCLFSSAEHFTWGSLNVTQRLVRQELPEGVWAAMVALRESRLCSTREQFSLKLDLMEHIWWRQGETETS